MYLVAYEASIVELFAKTVTGQQFSQKILSFMFGSGLNTSLCGIPTLKIVIPKVSESFCTKVCIAALCRVPPIFQNSYLEKCCWEAVHQARVFTK